MMQFRSKLFLALAVLFWGISYTRFGAETLHGIPKPLGAVFFGLFLIVWIFPRRDFEQFEQDQALRKRLISDSKAKRRRTKPVVGQHDRGGARESVYGTTIT